MQGWDGLLTNKKNNKQQNKKIVLGAIQELKDFDSKGNEPRVNSDNTQLSPINLWEKKIQNNKISSAKT